MKKLFLIIIIPFLSFGQIPITDDNINQAVGDWLADPIQAEDTYGHIIDWDVSQVTDMSYLFQSAISFNQDIGGWDVSGVTNMEWMFFEANSFNQDIGGWDVSSVTDMSWMFFEANSFNQDIGGWDVSNVVNMWGMFYSANFFNGNVESWSVGNVIYMSYMFRDASSFNQDIGDWDVIKVSDMAGMFFNATSFNQDIGGWNVGNVTNMGYMFRNATSFNQDVGSWNVSNVVYMGLMFHDITLSINNYDALLCGWSQLNLIEDITFSGGGSNYCSCDEARQNIIDNFNWNIIDGGPTIDCDETKVVEEFFTPELVKKIDILGRETTSKGFQLHIYDDGSVEKKYVIK